MTLDLLSNGYANKQQHSSSSLLTKHQFTYLHKDSQARCKSSLNMLVSVHFVFLSHLWDATLKRDLKFIKLTPQDNQLATQQLQQDQKSRKQSLSSKSSLRRTRESGMRRKQSRLQSKCYRQS